MAAKNGIPPLNTLKDCLVFLEWLNSGKGPKKLVVTSFVQKLKHYFPGMPGLKGPLQTEFFRFLENVSLIYKKLSSQQVTRWGTYTGKPNDILDALLECTPKLLAALSFIQYHVDGAFSGVGGGDWASLSPMSGNFQTFLTSGNNIIEGGFDAGELSSVQGGTLVEDLKKILNKDAAKGKTGYDHHRNVIMTTLEKQWNTFNTGNTALLVYAFCQLVTKTREPEGGAFKKALEKGHGNKICWQDLKNHCQHLHGHIEILTGAGFSFTGMWIGPKNVVHFAEKAGRWFRENLQKAASEMKGMIPHSIHSQMTVLQSFAEDKLYPHGFIFDGSNNSVRSKPRNLDDWNPIFQKFNQLDAMLTRLKDILDGYECGSATVVTKAEAAKPTATKTEATKTEATKHAATHVKAVQPPATTTIATPPPGGNTKGTPNQGQTVRGAQNTGSRNNVAPSQNSGQSEQKPAISSAGTSSFKPPGGIGAPVSTGAKGEKGPLGHPSTVSTTSFPRQNNVQRQSPSQPQPAQPPQAPPTGPPAAHGSTSQPGSGGGSTNGGGDAGKKAAASPAPKPQTPSGTSSRPRASVVPAPGGAPSTGGSQGLPAAGQPGVKGQGSQSGVPQSLQPTGAHVPASPQSPSVKGSGALSSVDSASGGGQGSSGAGQQYGKGQGSPGGGSQDSQSNAYPQAALSQPPSAPPLGPSLSSVPAPGNGTGSTSVTGQPGGEGHGAPGGGHKGQQPDSASSSGQSSTPGGTTQGPRASNVPVTSNGPGQVGQTTSSGSAKPGYQGTSQSSTTAATTTSTGMAPDSGGGGGVGGSNGKVDPEEERLREHLEVYGSKVQKRNYDARKNMENIWKKAQEKFEKINETKFRAKLDERRNTQTAVNRPQPPPIPRTQPIPHAPAPYPLLPGVPPGRGRDYYESRGRDIGQGNRGVQDAEIPISLGGEAVVDTDLKKLQDEWNNRIEADEKRKPLDWLNQASADLKQLMAFSLDGAEVSDVTNQVGKYVKNTMGSDVTATLNRNVVTSAMYDLDGDVVAGLDDPDMVAVDGAEIAEQKHVYSVYPAYMDGLEVDAIDGDAVMSDSDDSLVPGIDDPTVAELNGTEIAEVVHETQDKEWKAELQESYDELLRNSGFTGMSIPNSKGIWRPVDPQARTYDNPVSGDPIKAPDRPSTLEITGNPISAPNLNVRLQPLPIDIEVRDFNSRDHVLKSEINHRPALPVVENMRLASTSITHPRMPMASPDVNGNYDDSSTWGEFKDYAFDIAPNPNMCNNPWNYVNNSTTAATIPPPPDSDHLPPPTNVKAMLFWLVGLNAYGLIAKMERHMENILNEINGDTFYPKYALQVNGDLYSLSASHIADTLTEACLYSAHVLNGIMRMQSGDALSDIDFKSEYTKFCYSPDAASLLCQLRDYVYACHYQLQFLKAQCNRDKYHGGWKSYDYGSDSKVQSPLQSFLTDGWDSTFKTHLFDPYNLCHKSRVRMGFKKSDLPEKSQNGATLSAILTPSCGGDDPILTLCSYLNCITRRTPRTTGELVSYFHHIGIELHEYASKSLSPLGNSLLNPHPDCPDWDHLGLYDLGAVKGIRGSESLISKHNSSHDNDHPRTLSTLVGCGDDSSNCHPRMSPITYRAYALYSQSFAHTYLSWTVYLPDRLWESLEKLHYELKKHVSIKCSSLHLCSTALPLLYTHGFTPPEVGSQPTLTCQQVIAKLKEIVNGGPIATLMTAMDNFLFTIREPFIFTLVALWSLAFLICAKTMLYRLDVLHIRSHLIRTKASHHIDVKALLTKGRKMLSLYNDVDYFDEDPIGYVGV
ncbi:hypothetical protein BBBOND_0311470 [Babesia bigemina]|uniref:Ribosome binding protein n=1 Tax=Babesia bigemina TaxID=5866 RepID=A0A061DDB1_BABBI|nr:hypothetical protein BBBOND_0311470 [Babesia bigemina]CDR97244.1 hypothetical protein BBBOND_0311470 [Babesia bigemina]|eukprot:XP_012769430.1 hypothetical protein BBBOND_0311470 [Babesia bigemina]